MKKIQATFIAILACIASMAFYSCGDDEDDPVVNDVTVTLQQTSLTIYQPSGTFSIPVRLSDSGTTLTASDVKILLTSQAQLPAPLSPYPALP